MVVYINKPNFLSYKQKNEDKKKKWKWVKLVSVVTTSQFLFHSQKKDQDVHLIAFNLL